MKKRAVIDIDGVLADMHGKMLEIYNTENNKNLQICDLETWELPAELREIFTRAGFFRDLPLVPLARSFLSQLSIVCNVVIATSPSETPHIAMDKLYWVNKYLPNYTRSLCITEKKNIFDADILLDDNPDHVLSFNGSLPLLMVRPWNNDCNIDRSNRVYSLEEALLKIDYHVLVVK